MNIPQLIFPPKWWELEYANCIHPHQKRVFWDNTKLHLIVRLKIWRVWRTPSLPLLQVQLWLEVEVPVRVLFTSQINLLKKFSYLIGPFAKKKKAPLRNNNTKNINMNIQWSDSLTSRHKITLGKLICHYNQSIYLKKQQHKKYKYERTMNVIP